MKKTECYIFVVDVNQQYDTELLKQHLDYCLDWVRVVPGCYLLKSNSSMNELYIRFKNALGENRFFIIKADLYGDNYVGKLAKERWDIIQNRFNLNYSKK